MSMKRNFSCLMLLVILLFGASESIYGMVGAFSKAAMKAGTKGMMKTALSSVDNIITLLAGT